MTASDILMLAAMACTAMAKDILQIFDRLKKLETKTYKIS